MGKTRAWGAQPAAQVCRPGAIRPNVQQQARTCGPHVGDHDGPRVAAQTVLRVGKREGHASGTAQQHSFSCQLAQASHRLFIAQLKQPPPRLFTPAIALSSPSPPAAGV